MGNEQATEADNRDLVGAWERWLETGDGRKCADDTTGPTGKYLLNRLETAYWAGVEACRRLLRPATTGADEGTRLARLREMAGHPGLYSHGEGDTDAIRWAIRLIESIDAERERMRLERADMHRYRNAVSEAVERLTELREGP